MQAIHATISNRLLGELPRFFSGYEAMLRELYQNSHRAEATELRITLDDSRTVLVFHDNGNGCADPQDLLSAGQTGWDENKIIEPAGLGFFSLLNPELVSTVTVQSGCWSVTLKPERVLAGKDIEVSDSPCETKGMRIEIRFKAPVYVDNSWDKPSEEKWLEDIRDARGIYPMKVFINSVEYNSNEWNPVYEVQTPAGLVGIKPSYGPRKLVYWEYRGLYSDTFAKALNNAATSSADELAAPAITYYSWHWIVDPNCGARPVLPARDDLIAGKELDAAARVILAAGLKRMREDYAKAVRTVSDYGCSEHYNRPWARDVLGSNIPSDMTGPVLAAYGWKVSTFDDPSSFSYSQDENDGWDDVATYTIWDKKGKPVRDVGTMTTINTMRMADTINWSAYVEEDCPNPVTIKGLKVKSGSLVAVARQITVHGMPVPYLLVDAESTEAYLGDAKDVYVILAGTFNDYLKTLKDSDDIPGWVAMQVKECGDLYDYEDWMEHDDGDGEDDLSLANVRADLISDLMDNFGDPRMRRATRLYYEMGNAYDRVGEARYRCGGYRSVLKTGDRKIDAEIVRVVKSLDRVLDKIEKAKLAYGVRAKLVEKPAPKKRSRK